MLRIRCVLWSSFRVSVLTAFALSVIAQVENVPKYKTGDRVEWEWIHGTNGVGQVWKKATIVAVDPGPGGTASGSYTLRVDPLPGKAPEIYHIPIYTQDKVLRPLAGPAPTIATDQLRVDENNTVLADRDILDCMNLEHSGRNGDRPPPELIKKLIRCLEERPSPRGQDGATTVDVTQLNIATPRKWVLYRDIGQGTANTMVYPVHATFNKKTFYRTRNIQVTGAEGSYTCFADKFNFWVCGIAAGPSKEGQRQEIMVTAGGANNGATGGVRNTGNQITTANNNGQQTTRQDHGQTQQMDSGPVTEQASSVKNPDGTAPTFKVGDSVEVDPYSRRYGEKVWYRGTVSKVNYVGGTSIGGYTVTIKLPDGSAKDVSVGSSNIWIRAGK